MIVAATMVVAGVLALQSAQALPPALPPSLKASMETVRPEPQFDGWAVAAAPESPKPRAVVYRWFTTGCPWCRRSMPALEQLRREYEPRGIRIVAVFHPKPPAPVDVLAVAAAAKSLGFNGPVAIDQDWSELGRLAGPPGGLSATSVTLVLDGKRRLRHAHKGPVLHPSDDPARARADAGYKALRQALERLAGPPAATEDENLGHPPLAGASP